MVVKQLDLPSLSSNQTWQLKIPQIEPLALDPSELINFAQADAGLYFSLSIAWLQHPPFSLRISDEKTIYLYKTAESNASRVADNDNG